MLGASARFLSSSSVRVVASGNGAVGGQALPAAAFLDAAGAVVVVVVVMDVARRHTATKSPSMSPAPSTYSDNRARKYRRRQQQWQKKHQRQKGQRQRQRALYAKEVRCVSLACSNHQQKPQPSPPTEATRNIFSNRTSHPLPEDKKTKYYT